MSSVFTPSVAPVPLPPVVLSPVLLGMLRQRIGLDAADPAQDSALAAAYEAAVRVTETYLDRYIVAGTYVERFTHFRGRTLSLRGYPLVSDPQLVGDDGASLGAWHIDSQAGLLQLDATTCAHEVQVTYDAAPNIPALSVALLLVFDLMWAQFSGSPGSSTGAVKSIASNGARVEYHDAGQPSQPGSLAAAGMPSGAAALLAPYRRLSC